MGSLFMRGFSSRPVKHPANSLKRQKTRAQFLKRHQAAPSGTLCLPKLPTTPNFGL
jgi:hypothetical protein